MSEWNSSNHFKCVHYEDSSWCKKTKSKIWENDPCPEFHPSMSHTTPKPLDASNGRRIPVESRTDSERDRPKEARNE